MPSLDLARARHAAGAGTRRALAAVATLPSRASGQPPRPVARPENPPHLVEPPARSLRAAMASPVRAITPTTRTTASRAQAVTTTLAPRARTAAATADAWWRSLTTRAATFVMVAVATIALAAGMGATALATAPDAGPAAGAGPALPGATALGPLTIVLPAGLGPWTEVPTSSVDGLRAATSGSGFTVADAWGLVAPGALVATVVVADAGSHPGVEGLVGPFEEAGIDLAWSGDAPHVAGSSDDGGLRELVLAVELPDGALAVLSVSGPVASFADGDLDASLQTVRFAG